MHKTKQADHLIEVFRTNRGAVYQSNRTNKYFLEFLNYSSFFKPGDFLHFKQQVECINLEKMLQCQSRSGDIALLMPHYSDCCFILSIPDIVDLKELLTGAKFMLQLNSMVHECLYRSMA